MTEAKLIRKQHFQSQIFTEEPPTEQHRIKRSNTFESSVFAEVVPDRVKQKQVQTTVNFARKKYQTESNVMEGALEQAALVVDKNKERNRPSSNMKTAGKKESPTCDFTYKPRATTNQKSHVFTLSHDNSDLLDSRSQNSQFLQKATDSGIRRLKVPDPKEKRNPSKPSTGKISKPLQDSGTPATLQQSNAIDLTQHTTKASSTGLAKSQSEAQILDFAVSGLRANMTSEELRRLCGNVQIISVKTEGNPVSGECRGFGTIQARVSSQAKKLVSSMELNLAEQGVRISQKISRGKRPGFIQ